MLVSFNCNAEKHPSVSGRTSSSSLLSSLLGHFSPVPLPSWCMLDKLLHDCYGYYDCLIVEIFDVIKWRQIVTWGHISPRYYISFCSENYYLSFEHKQLISIHISVLNITSRKTRVFSLIRQSTPKYLGILKKRHVFAAKWYYFASQSMLWMENLIINFCTIFAQHKLVKEKEICEISTLIEGGELKKRVFFGNSQYILALIV